MAYFTSLFIPHVGIIDLGSLKVLCWGRL